MKPLLEVKNLTFAFRTKIVLSGIDFSARRGSFTAILGPNGCGKTTLLKLIQRLYSPGEGRVTLSGVDLRLFPRRELAARIAAVSQTVPRAFDFTVSQFVMLGRTPHLGFWKHENSKDREVVEDALRRASCAEYRQSLISELSAGEFQRVCVAAALAQEPEILLLDEPTSFLDLRQSRRLSQLLSQLVAGGMTVLCASHDISFLRPLADSALLLNRGRSVGFGPATDLLASSALQTLFEEEEQIPPQVKNYECSF